MAEYPLAELLLRRKELEGHVARLKVIQEHDMYEVKVARRKVDEGIDEIKAAVPKLTYDEAQGAYNWYARMLRKTDAAIQRANWDTTVTSIDDLMEDYVSRVK